MSFGRTLVYLVHGTWGRGVVPSSTPRKKPRWFEKGSGFSNRLTLSLGGESATLKVVPFEWSGANSLIERHRAAVALAERIEGGLRPFLRTRVVIVGHSHGGNVALMASHMLRERTAPRWLQVDVITLATPFVRVAPAVETGWSRHGPSIVITAFVFYLLLVHGMQFAPFIRAVGYANNTLPEAIFGPGMLIALIAVSVLIGFLWSPFTGMPGPNDGLGAVRLRQHAARRLERILIHTPPTEIPAGSRMLIVRGFNDEASMVLVAGSLGNLLSSWVFNLGGVFLLWVPFAARLPAVLSGCALIALLVAVVFGIPDWALSFISLLFSMAERVPWQMVPEAMGWLIVIAFCSMLAAQPFKCVYGRELFLWSSLVEVTADSVPDGSAAVDVVTLPPSSEQDDSLSPRWAIRHSIHRSKACADAVAAWVSARPPLDGPPAH